MKSKFQILVIQVDTSEEPIQSKCVSTVWHQLTIQQKLLV